MSKNRDAFSEINITPLTDIFLVLLIIMMVIAPMLDQQGLNLTVPENVTAEQHNKDLKIMTIMIAENDSFSIDGKTIEGHQLEQSIKGLVKDYPDGLLIKADGNSSHGAMVKVMDSARNSGVTSISVDQI
ncbi:MAG: biopolymer transporter ExbD [Candidatus Gastranaerophilales bacterium]